MFCPDISNCNMTFQFFKIAVLLISNPYSFTLVTTGYISLEIWSLRFDQLSCYRFSHFTRGVEPFSSFLNMPCLFSLLNSHKHTVLIITTYMDNIVQSIHCSQVINSFTDRTDQWKLYSPNLGNTFEKE